MANAGSPTMVKLNVGGRIFYTTVGTLVGRSNYFAAMFSGLWTVEANHDDKGCIFLDTDPDIFEHILRYLRRGTFPFLLGSNSHSGKRTYCRKTYFHILEEARYFQTPMLEAYLEGEVYHKIYVYPGHNALGWFHDQGDLFQEYWEDRKDREDREDQECPLQTYGQ